MRPDRIALAIFLALTSLGVSTASAGQCPVKVRGPGYRLMGDTVDWSVRITSGLSCTRVFRYNHFATENVQLVSPPHAGEVALQRSGLSYTSKSEYQGEDSFAVTVSGSPS